MGIGEVSKHTLARLPHYLDYLKKIKHQGELYASAPKLAKIFKLNEVQVRKDIARISSCDGKPKCGFEVAQLVYDIETFLGFHNVSEVILVGAGHLGRALMHYDGFCEYGMKIVAAFDIDETIIENDLETFVFPLKKMPELIQRLNVQIAILTVPTVNAQTVCDALVSCGIKAILNFAPTHLFVPDDVLVKNENLASSLALLSTQLKERTYFEKEKHDGTGKEV